MLRKALTSLAVAAVAVTTHMVARQQETRWIFNDGPDKGYVCALLQQDGPNFDVFIPALEPTPGTFLSPALLPVPWRQFTTLDAATALIAENCPLRS